MIIQERIAAEFRARDADRAKYNRALHKMAVTPFEGIARKVKSIFLQCIPVQKRSAIICSKHAQTRIEVATIYESQYKASAVLHLHFPLRYLLILS